MSTVHCSFAGPPRIRDLAFAGSGSTRPACGGQDQAVERPASLAAALVRAARRHGQATGPQDGLGPARWGDIAIRARRLSLGLAAIGVGRGSVVGLATPRLDDTLVVEQALLGVGAAVDLDGLDPEVPTVDAHGLLGPNGATSLADLEERGERVDRHDPTRFDELIAAVSPGDQAVVGDGRPVTHAQALWALRGASRWLDPAGEASLPGARPPIALTALDDEAVGRLVRALLGRWWPTASGATVHTVAADTVSSTLRRVRPEFLLAGPDGWDDVAVAVRAGVPDAELRRARLEAAGEPDGRSRRAVRRLGARRRRTAVRLRIGLEGAGRLVAVGGLSAGAGLDLPALGLPIEVAWVPRGVVVPASSGAAGVRADVGRPFPGRPLPGRSVAVASDGTLSVHGGDLPHPLDVPGSRHLGRRIGSGVDG